MADLTTQQIEQLTRLLDERERFLSEDIRREVNNRDEYQQLAGEAPDPGDQATASTVLDLNHAEVSRDIAELREIEAARERMKDGDYGFCVQCGIDIPFERLKVQPSAGRCTPCQAMFEKTHASSANTSSGSLSL